MKVALLTINDYENYGNRIQNYAMEQILLQQGMQVTTLYIERDIASIKKNGNIKDKIVQSSFQEILYFLKNKVNNKIYRRKIIQKRKLFQQFTNRYINESKNVICSAKELEKVSQEYDAFIVGSDQVWNPNYDDGRHLFFLPFQTDKIKVSVAASFGIEKISELVAGKYLPYLSGFQGISVREKSGVKILRNMGLDGSVVADPTILFGVEKWKEQVKTHTKKEKKEEYIFVYFLGYRDSQVQRRIKTISREYQLEIIDVMDIRERYYATTDPLDFIQYISDAKLVITDSFHATVFSLLMQTSVVVCGRVTQSASLNTRIDDLLEMFHMDDCRYENMDWNNIFQNKCTSVDEIISEKKREFVKFLLKSGVVE